MVSKFFNVKPQYIIPTTKKINILLAKANDLIKLPIILASQGGKSRSEICRLTKDDFTDLGVTINKAVVYDNLGKLITKTAKTIADNRFVPLPSNVINIAKRWQHYNLTPSALSNAFEHLRNSCDVPKFSFHKLRHYFASELHSQGIPDQYIVEIGGWQTVEMLHNIYQHTLRDKQEQTAQKIINIFITNFNKNNAKKRNAANHCVSFCVN